MSLEELSPNPKRVQAFPELVEGNGPTPRRSLSLSKGTAPSRERLRLPFHHPHLRCRQPIEPINLLINFRFQRRYVSRRVGLFDR